MNRFLKIIWPHGPAGEKALMTILILCLIAQTLYLLGGRSLIPIAQTRRIHDGTGGPSAPAPPGQMQPPPEGRMIKPPPGGHRMEPPPGGQPGSPGVPPPGSRPGGRITTYPVIPRGKELTEREKMIVENKYLLHRWILSDLLWGVVELEKSKKHQLSDKQVKKIFPKIKKLVYSIEVVERSNRLMKGLLTDGQIAYFEEKLYDGAYMSSLMAKYSPGEAEPVFGASEAVAQKCREIVAEKAKKYKKK